MPIESIYIKNYKSIRDSGLIEIKPINILIGANGVGKSNFISFFKLLNSIYEQKLRIFVANNGYENRMLYFGRKVSKFLAGSIIFSPPSIITSDFHVYNFKLVPQAQGNGFFFQEETVGFQYNNFNPLDGSSFLTQTSIEIDSIGKSESELKNYEYIRNKKLKNDFNNFKVFHFHDTSASSPLKQVAKTHDYDNLKEDGSNLAAYLFKIKDTHPSNYKIIEYTIRSVAPFFDRFELKPDAKNPEVIFLNWLEKGSDEYFDAHDLSDGTLRFIALTTLLLQPDLPKTIIIDEPELGLHPFAIQKLAAMVKSASTKAQIIISTQSVNFLDQFEAEDIIVVERQENQTVFKRQDKQALAIWLEEYSIGELWDKNILGGTP